MPNIRFDWTFNMGHVITVTIFVAGMIMGYVNLTNTVTSVAEKQTASDKVIAEIRQDLRDLRSVVITALVSSPRQISSGR